MIPWIREWLPTPVFLPGEFHGQRSQVGYSWWGCRVGHDWATNTHTHVHSHTHTLYWPEYLTNQNLFHQDWLIVLLYFILSWILYEKPNFEGHSIPLEEGELELSGLWGIEDILERNEDEAVSPKPMVIGSIRLVVQVGKISKLLIKANWISSIHSASTYWMLDVILLRVSFCDKSDWEKYFVFYG